MIDFIACKKDGFPTLIIDGKRQCVGEYLDRCIGNKVITNVIASNEKAFFYVFEDGHELPLLCAGCGKFVELDNLNEEKEKIIGRHVLSTGWNEADYGAEGMAVELVLRLGRNDEEGLNIIDIYTSLNSAEKLIHPETCLHKKKDVADLRKQKKKKSPKKKRKRHKSKKQSAS